MVPGIVVPVAFSFFSYPQKDGLPQLLLKKVVAVGTHNNPKPFAIGFCCVSDFQAQIESGVQFVESNHLFLEGKGD